MFSEARLSFLPILVVFFVETQATCNHKSFSKAVVNISEGICVNCKKYMSAHTVQEMCSFESRENFFCDVLLFLVGRSAGSFLVRLNQVILIR